MRARLVFVAWAAAALAAGACSDPIDPGGEHQEETLEPDPLDTIEQSVDAGSLDDLYRKVLLPSCAGQAGLCHAGQFEPNLSTPALAFYNLVERPSLEKPDRLRVAPGKPQESVLVDKLRNRDVISVMPLGAEPVPEEQIAAIEAWITAGAPRFAGAEPSPAINEPPEEPELAIFDAAGERLDLGGAASAAPGETVVFRMTTHDFETPDEDMVYVAFNLQTADGQLVVLNDDSEDPTSAYATFDEEGAPLVGDEVMNWRFDWVIPQTVDLYDFEGNPSLAVPTEGMSFFVIGAYIPEAIANDYVIAVNFTPNGLQVLP
ncbi:MAG: hypothetical protein JNL21_26315 [Myxococcales bacterium]|nr:hypothetical protein [Myxococcales bacterium]